MASNLYIIGNTGVGKSWLCNCLLGRWEFDSKNQADSCTREVSSVETWLPTTYQKDENIVAGALPLRIFNVPGLLEADPERVKQNVRLLQSALDRKEMSLVLYVLTTEGGRIRDSDYAAFKALSEAYDLHQHSCMFVVNKCSKRDNRQQITAYIHKVLGPFEVGFLPGYDLSDQELEAEIKLLHTQVTPMVVDMIRHLIPTSLRKQKELKLEADHIEDLKKQSQQSKIQFEKEMNQMRQESNAIQQDNVRKTGELAAARQALYSAQNSHHRGGHGAIRLGPLSFEW